MVIWLPAKWLLVMIPGTFHATGASEAFCLLAIFSGGFGLSHVETHAMIKRRDDWGHSNYTFIRRPQEEILQYNKIYVYRNLIVTN